MALLKLGGIVTKISGRVGGQVTGTGVNGSYIKNNSYSQQKNSPAQSVQRNKIGIVSQFWRTLSIAQKNAWIAETSNYPYTNRVGDVVEYTGYQLYNFLNLNRQVLGLTRNDNVPSFVALATPTYSISVLDNTQVIIGYTGGVVGNSVAIYATRGMQNTNKPKDGDYKLVSTPSLVNGSSTIDITGVYISIFNDPIPSEYITFRFKTIVASTGNASNVGNQITEVVV